MNQEEHEKWVAEWVLRLYQMAQEAFAGECEARDQERNMAVLSSALVRTGVKVMVGFCPREKLGQAMESLVYQINQGLKTELNPPPLKGVDESVLGSSAANGPMGVSVVGQVEGEVSEPQNQPKK